MNDGLQRRIDDSVALSPLAPSVDVSAAISVIMVVYRTGNPLAESIRRVLADPHVDQFILVDNGSSDEERDLIDSFAAEAPDMTVLRGQGNVGFARAVNLGLGIAKGDVVVVLNPDAFLEPGCVRALHRTLKGRKVPALVGARVMNPDGTEQRGARRGEVTPMTSLLSLTGVSKKIPALHNFEVHHEDDPEPVRGIPVPTISGACFAMRRQDFLDIGGLDAGYFLHVEDVDLCWRVRREGGEVLFEPRARVIHLGSTSQASPIKVEYWKGIGLARYFRKRADNKRRQALAIALTPFIIAVSVMRPVLRGQMFKARGGLRF
jgi:N-acetylglucosaminyl-diphospho-decaprenol L-rhamnosyltransferase